MEDGTLISVSQKEIRVYTPQLRVTNTKYAMHNVQD
jgi:hypothetical protein